MARRALIIEDNADLAALLEMVLSAAGHEVETTPSGLDGLLRFSKRPFDVVLLDMEIDELSGPGTHRAIRDMCAGAAVICMSAQRGGWMDDALNQGATACLPKPFSPEELLALLDTLWSGELGLPGFPSDVRTLGPGDLAQLAAMALADLDALPFGAVRLDAAGRVTAFNAYEARASGRSPETMLGAKFADVAPCTQVKQFLSALEEGLANKRLDRVLRFVFPRRGARCVVAVRLYYDPLFEQTWLFVSAANGQAQECGPRR